MASSRPGPPLWGDLCVAVTLLVLGTAALALLDLGALLVVALSTYCEDECGPPSGGHHPDAAAATLVVAAVLQLAQLGWGVRLGVASARRRDRARGNVGAALVVSLAYFAVAAVVALTMLA